MSDNENPDPETVAADDARDAQVRALQREREGYVLRDMPDRLKAVDAELKRLGFTREEAHEGTERTVRPPAARRGKATS